MNRTCVICRYHFKGIGVSGQAVGDAFSVAQIFVGRFLCFRERNLPDVQTRVRTLAVIAEKAARVGFASVRDPDFDFADPSKRFFLTSLQERKLSNSLTVQRRLTSRCFEMFNINRQGSLAIFSRRLAWAIGPTTTG